MLGLLFELTCLIILYYLLKKHTQIGLFIIAYISFFLCLYVFFTKKELLGEFEVGIYLTSTLLIFGYLWLKGFFKKTSFNIVFALKLLLIGLIFLSMLKMPYRYYEFFRLSGFGIFSLLALKTKRLKYWCIFYVICAIIVQPFFKMSISRESWIIIDLLLVVSLVYSEYNSRLSKFGNIFYSYITLGLLDSDAGFNDDICYERSLFNKTKRLYKARANEFGGKTSVFYELSLEKWDWDGTLSKNYVQNLGSGKLAFDADVRSNKCYDECEIEIFQFIRYEITIFQFIRYATKEILSAGIRRGTHNINQAGLYQGPKLNHFCNGATLKESFCFKQWETEISFGEIKYDSISSDIQEMVYVSFPPRCNHSNKVLGKYKSLAKALNAKNVLSNLLIRNCT